MILRSATHTVKTRLVRTCGIMTDNRLQLLHEIKLITGVVEVGLFCHMAKAAYFGNQDGSVTIKWHDGRIEKVAGNESAIED